jgi:hypothetical protein
MTGPRFARSVNSGDPNGAAVLGLGIM